MDFAEVALAHAKQRRAVNLGVAAYPVAGARAERVAIAIRPDLVRVVAVLLHHVDRAPVLLFAGQKATALENEDLLAGVRQPVPQGPAARTGADDDDVVAFHPSPTPSHPKVTCNRIPASA